MWQLEGSADGIFWEPINAGQRDTPVRGRFYADQTLYRVLWASHSGSTAASPALTIPGLTRPRPTRHDPSKRREVIRHPGNGSWTRPPVP